MNVAIVDLGLNNMSSLKRAINKSVTDVVQLDLNEVGFSRNIDIVVLPGVGHFGAASRALDEKNLRKNILDLHQENVPILGICLGLHLFFETSGTWSNCWRG
jgi:glutamine amidotransferase